MCTFDDEALLKFAFQLIDKDGSGYVDSDEIVDMVKAVHGSKFNKSLTGHVKKVMKKYDQNGDDQAQGILGNQVTGRLTYVVHKGSTKNTIATTH